MSFSLNEVDAMSKRAARGAGYSWGLAEEAGKAVRWMCAHDLDGTAELAKLLRDVECVDLTDRMPSSIEGRWKAAGDTLCPLIAGAALSDRAAELPHRAFQMDTVACPLLMLPFAAWAARYLKASVSVEGPGIAAITDGEGVVVRGVADKVAEGVTVRVGRDIVPRATHRDRVEPSADVWDTLDRFARRTFAPATEESRLKGAGAGLSDND